MIAAMQLRSSLSFLVDEASGVLGAEAFLTALGAKLVADGLPLAGGALTQAAPHPIIARRTWLWRADTGGVIEALGFGFTNSEHIHVGRDWLARLGTGVVEENLVGAVPDGAVLGWAATVPFSASELELLHEVARFARAPLAVLAARSTLAVLLEKYLAGAAPRRYWRAGCGASPARPSAPRCSMPICAASPNYRSWPRRRRS